MSGDINTKFIGEAKIKDFPKKRVGFKLRPGSVTTSIINDGAITKPKLSSELWDEIGRLASNELLVAVYGYTTYQETLWYYQNGKIIVGKAGDLYFNLTSYNQDQFTFTQIDENGTLHTMVLTEENGWINTILHSELATGDVAMEIIELGNNN